MRIGLSEAAVDRTIAFIPLLIAGAIGLSYAGVGYSTYIGCIFLTLTAIALSQWRKWRGQWLLCWLLIPFCFAIFIGTRSGGFELPEKFRSSSEIASAIDGAVGAVLVAVQSRFLLGVARLNRERFRKRPAEGESLSDDLIAGDAGFRTILEGSADSPRKPFKPWAKS